MLEQRWTLDDLYTSFESPEYKHDFASYKAEIAALSKWAQEELASADNAAAKLEYYVAKINELSKYNNLGSYAALVISTDTTNAAATKAGDAYGVASAELSTPRTLFMRFVGTLPDLDGVVAQSELLKEHAYFLAETRGKYAHSLSEREEVLLAKLKTSGSTAWENQVRQLTSTLEAEITLDGNNKAITLAELRNLNYSSDAAARKAGFEAELSSYKKIEKAIAFSINSVKGEAITVAKQRGYESILDMTLHSSRLERCTLDAMLSAMRDFLPSLRRYYKHKARALSHANGRLPYYALFAPIGSTDMRLTYDEAADFIVKHFSGFSSRKGDFARRMFDEGHIDAEPRSGKSGGAFCHNLHPIKQSRVLINYDNSFYSMTIMAHELGHAYHGYCLNDASYINSVYTMPIAETASIFAETIITNAALSAATRDEAFVILDNQLSSMCYVILDIFSRYIFETNLIDARQHGPLTVDELNALMAGAQKESYGDALDHDLLHPYMWLCKPHYYMAERNFYNFPYMYGLLFGNGLYSIYKREGDGFAAKYDAILAATGSNSLEAVGDISGLNVRSKEFWSASLKVVEEAVDKFCEM